MAVDNDEPYAFSDESDYEQQGISAKDVILRHIRKISDITCQEFTGGYWEKKPIKTSSGILFVEKYHEDVREAYCNAVDFLIDVVYPISDTEMKLYFDEHEPVNFDLEIKEKLKLKRTTFRKINIMFDRTNFFQSSDNYNE